MRVWTKKVHLRWSIGRDLKIYNLDERRRSNERFFSYKTKRINNFQFEGKLDTALVLYTTPVWAFSRLQDGANSEPRAVTQDWHQHRHYNCSSSTKALLKSLNKLQVMKYASQFSVASLKCKNLYRVLTAVDVLESFKSLIHDRATDQQRITFEPTNAAVYIPKIRWSVWHKVVYIYTRYLCSLKVPIE